MKIATSNLVGRFILACPSYRNKASLKGAWLGPRDYP